jgi:hypothetical protein
MARQLLRFGCFLSTLTASLAVPIEKRWNQDDIFDGKHPLQGVEVNGLFNPIERYSILVPVTNAAVSPLTCLNELLKSMATI